MNRTHDEVTLVQRRFLSCEPLLGAVDLEDPMRGARSDRADVADARIGGSAVDWVIVGGESGKGARRMDPAWIRTIRDQCREFDVPFFFKQADTMLARDWGAHGKGGDPAEWPEPFPREFPRTVPDTGPAHLAGAARSQR